MDQETDVNDRLRFCRENLSRLPEKDQVFFTSISKSYAQWGSTPGRERAIWAIYNQCKRAVGGVTRIEAPAKIKGENLSRIFELFAVAAKNTKWPAITLTFPGAKEAVRISLAGDKSKYAGDITLTSVDKIFNDYSPYGQRRWFGRISKEDGQFYPGKEDALGFAEGLAALAKDPVQVAVEYGRRGSCCIFCNASLGGETASAIKSAAVGFGETCSKTWGLHDNWKHALEKLPIEEQEAVQEKLKKLRAAKRVAKKPASDVNYEADCESEEAERHERRSY
jgi:hypothetical protein